MPTGQVPWRRAGGGVAQEPGPFVPQASRRDPYPQSPRPKSHLRIIRLPGTWPLPVLPHTRLCHGGETESSWWRTIRCPKLDSLAGWPPEELRPAEAWGRGVEISDSSGCAHLEGRRTVQTSWAVASFCPQQGHTHGLDTEGHGDTSVLGRGNGATPTSAWVTFSLSPTAPASPVEAGTGPKPVLLGGGGRTPAQETDRASLQALKCRQVSGEASRVSR